MYYIICGCVRFCKPTVANLRPEPEALPKDGNLRGATMRTAMGSFHLRPFGQACVEGYFGGSFARTLEDAGNGALAAQAIDEIVALLGSGFRRKTKTACGITLGPRPVRARLLFARAAGPRRRPRGARGTRRGPFVLRWGSHLAELFLHRARGAGQRGAGGGGGCHRKECSVTFENYVSVKFQVMRIWIKSLLFR